MDWAYSCSDPDTVLVYRGEERADKVKVKAVDLMADLGSYPHS